MANFDSLSGFSDLPSGPDLDGVSEQEPTLEAAPTEAASEEAGAGEETAEVSSEANTEVAEATAEEDASEAVEVPPEEKPAPAASPKPKSKQYTFKVGDQDVAVDETAVIKHKVDGKLEDIPVKDLINQYAGKVAIDKRFTELDRARKSEAARVQEFENARQRHVSLIKDMHEHVSQGRLFEAVANMIEMTGAKSDPQQFISALEDKLLERAQQLAQMTPEQRAALKTQEHNTYLQQKYDRLMKQRDQEQAQAAFQGRVAKAIESVNATMESYVEAKQYLEQNAGQMRVAKEQITPEFVANHIRNVRDYETARDALTEVSPDLASDDKTWDQAVFLLRQHPTWTKEDLRDVFQQALGQRQSSAVSKKVAKAPVATTAGAAAKAKASPQSTRSKVQALRESQDPAAYKQLPPEAFIW
jgi:hypothetical protein